MLTELEITDGASAGAWIEPELTGEFGSVVGTVPDRFNAYARILHPAKDQDGPVTWAQVAAARGRKVHPLVQWRTLTERDSPGSGDRPWPGGEPALGDLSLSLLVPLCKLLAEHTSEAESCFYGIWAGRTWTTFTAVHDDTSGEIPPPPSWHSTEDLSFAFSSTKPEQPLLHLPRDAGRDYHVLRGPLSALAATSEGLDPALESLPTSPSMIWPQDRAWFLASDIDFDSTLVGGSENLVAAILEDSRFEAFQIGKQDLLTFDADRLNRPGVDDR